MEGNVYKGRGVGASQVNHQPAQLPGSGFFLRLPTTFASSTPFYCDLEPIQQLRDVFLLSRFSVPPHPD